MKTLLETRPKNSSTLPAPSAPDLPDYAPPPRSALGPALNEQGFYVGRVREFAAARRTLSAIGAFLTGRFG